MPFFEFCCDKCKVECEKLFLKPQTEEVLCPKCEQLMRRKWSAYSHIRSERDWRDFMDEMAPPLNPTNDDKTY